MYYCKQCCTYVEMKDRAVDQAAERTTSKIKIAPTSQQQLLSRLLREQEVPKDQAAAVVQDFTREVDQWYRSRPMATSMELVQLLEDSIDRVVGARSRSAASASSAGPSSGPVLPTAFMAGMEEDEDLSTL